MPILGYTISATHDETHDKIGIGSISMSIKDDNKPLSFTGVIIEGVTEAGEIFRPSDWAERLCGALSTFKKNRIDYSPLLTPSVQNGHKCVLLNKILKESNPALYEHVLEFAQENHLKICDTVIKINKDDKNTI